ncbi:MAG: hypothetical protein J6W95_04870 [Bacteroidales bacterium]|nr:hypothetical protein [Bacteroidales bacterium]
MIKRFKLFALLLIAAATMTTLFACNKDNVENVKLSDTEWGWSDDNATGIIDLSVEFNGPKLASLDYTDMSTGVMDVNILIGSYSVDGNKGTLSLRDEDAGTSVNVDFTVNGNKMTLKFKGTNYTLTKED